MFVVKFKFTEAAKDWREGHPLEQHFESKENAEEFKKHAENSEYYSDVTLEEVINEPKS